MCNCQRVGGQTRALWHSGVLFQSYCPLNGYAANTWPPYAKVSDDSAPAPHTCTRARTHGRRTQCHSLEGRGVAGLGLRWVPPSPGRTRDRPQIRAVTTEIAQRVGHDHFQVLINWFVAQASSGSHSFTLSACARQWDVAFLLLHAMCHVALRVMLHSVPLRATRHPYSLPCHVLLRVSS